MNTMDCSICYEAITGATGKVELSCSHTFHFSCLTKWFGSQHASSQAESCPCCRHQSNAFEKLTTLEEEEEEEDDDETMEYNPPILQAAARERAVQKFAVLRSRLSQDQLEHYAASRIASTIRCLWARDLKIQLMTAKDNINMGTRLVAQALASKKINLLAIGVSYSQWKSSVATLIQGAWRRYIYKKKALAKKNSTFDRIVEELSMGRLVVWMNSDKPEISTKKVSTTWKRLDDARWERAVLNPEDQEYEVWNRESQELMPQSLEFELAMVTRKIQAVWRGYSVRQANKKAKKPSRSRVCAAFYYQDNMMIEVKTSY
jgi:hypothetical protein